MLFNVYTYEYIPTYKTAASFPSLCVISLERRCGSLLHRKSGETFLLFQHLVPPVKDEIVSFL